MSDRADMASVAAETERPQFSLAFPATVELSHPELSAGGLFQLAYALDGYELQRDPTDPSRLIKDSMTVDVLETTPQSTKIRITPKRQLTHFDLLAQIDRLLKACPRGIFNDKLQIAKISWDVPAPGAASDERSNMKRIQ